MDLSNIIKENIKFIEQKTGNGVIINIDENIKADAITDFGGWNDMKNLPKILHKQRINKIHILHELIHLKSFFVDGYSLIACSNPCLHPIINLFKNIPEDYVAHKVIKLQYGLNPIDTSWFLNKENLTLTDDQIVVNLIQFHAFSEFCPNYKDKLKLFIDQCRTQKPGAFRKADRAIEALENINYKKKDSYNECAGEFIKIFSSTYFYEKKIYLSYLSKWGDLWKWNP